MIVLAGESGLRADELCHLDALGPHRDLFYEHNCVQTRYGKATNGSGKRVRKTIFTDLAQATMRPYEAKIRPLFRNAMINVSLFLTERGERMNYTSMWCFFDRIIVKARKAELYVPPKMTWHSLRRSFATNYIEQHPGDVWKLMEYMGHQNLSTLHRYVIHTREYFERAQGAMVEELLP